MNDTHQRKHERQDSLNLVDYVVLDEAGVQVARAMGRTRNVSEGGILLETHRALTAGQKVLISLGLYDDTVELKGTVVHTEPSEEKGFCSGIAFEEVGDKGRRILKSYVQFIKAENLTG